MVFTILLVVTNLLWWFTEIKHKSSIDVDDSMIGLAFLTLLIVFSAILYHVVKIFISFLKKDYRWLYTYLLVNSALVTLFFVKWVPST